jgi:hypothetical protein
VTETSERRSPVNINIWTYRETVSPKDLVGYAVEATDGRIGKVDKATYDVGSSYTVVDTGPWIFGRKVLLPAWTITGIDADEQKMFVDRSKDEIKNGPEYDADMWDATTSPGEYERYYGPYYNR